MKLKNKDILALYGAFNKFYPTGENKVPTYTFKAKVSYALARDYKAIKNVLDDLEATRVETFKKYRQGEELTLTGENAVKFATEFEDLLNQEVEIPILQIDVNDLDLDKNQINATEVLAVLMDSVVIGEIK